MTIILFVYFTLDSSMHFSLIVDFVLEMLHNIL
jgi:hypothetical protein